MTTITDNINKLALDGGTPVRTKPLPLPYLGTSVMGQEEMELLREVVDLQLPFREYGCGNPHMVKDFEREARDYFNVKYALGTATGSGSFFCALAGLGVGPGDEIIIPCLNWFTNYVAPLHFGAIPVFAEVDRSLNLSPKDFEKKITDKTKAVIVVHFQGTINNFDEILSIAKMHNIFVIEDCAQACGATYKGKKVGSIGDVACFSFQQNKIMSTGDGGLLTTNQQQVFERAVRYHDLGSIRPSLEDQLEEDIKTHPIPGLQFRMNEFTGAVALAQLRKLDSHILNKTRQCYKYLRNKLSSECPGIKFRQSGDLGGDCGIALYVDLGTPKAAKKFAKALDAEGIRVGPSSGCRNLLHEELVQKKYQVHPDLPPFGDNYKSQGIQYRPDLCPESDDIFESMVAIAIVPAYSQQDVDDIAQAIKKVWKHIPPVQ